MTAASLAETWDMARLGWRATGCVVLAMVEGLKVSRLLVTLMSACTGRCVTTVRKKT